MSLHRLSQMSNSRENLSRSRADSNNIMASAFGSQYNRHASIENTHIIVETGGAENDDEAPEVIRVPIGKKRTIIEQNPHFRNSIISSILKPGGPGEVPPLFTGTMVGASNYQEKIAMAEAQQLEDRLSMEKPIIESQSHPEPKVEGI